MKFNLPIDKTVDEVANMIAAGDVTSGMFDQLQAKLDISAEEMEAACQAVFYMRLDAALAYRSRLQDQLGELITGATRIGRKQADIEFLAASSPWSLGMLVYRTDVFVDWYFSELDTMPDKGDSYRDMLVRSACGAAKTSFIERIFELFATAHPEARA